jgi:uncharacterized NAD-dependent epimerase/dehydratase family protein
LAAKTAHGIAHWRPELCVGQLRLAGCNADLGLPDLKPEEAKAKGAQTMVIGVANAGGVLSPAWIDSLVAALDAGLDLASGLHGRLADIPAVAEAAARHGHLLHDVRHTDQTLPTGKGTPRSGKRLLTVGTDCSVGKKFAALAIERALRARGVDADFRATGQTGILIAGSGIAIDAVGADFIAGAVETLAPSAGKDHWDVIEGQGSLFHPSFAGVSLGLLHGAQADAFVVCHEPTRNRMRGVDVPLPSIEAVVETTIALGRLTNPQIRFVGIAVNTAALDAQAAKDRLQALSDEYGVPAVDPVAGTADAIVEELAAQGLVTLDGT